jgi:hypothetical protein
MVYPSNHRTIVEDLMKGKFVLSTEKHFESLKNNEEFYQQFFQESFGLALRIQTEYAFLISTVTNETLSKSISIFFAVLCYELDKDGKNFMDQLQYNEFDMDTIERYFQNTSYIDLVKATKQLEDEEKRKTLIETMRRRNIIERTGEDRFIFTSAYKVFTEFALELVRKKREERASEEAEKQIDIWKE